MRNPARKEAAFIAQVGIGGSFQSCIGTKMKITRVLRFLTGGGHPPPSCDYLLSARHMAAMLERERLRADRHESVFSLVTFEVEQEILTPLVQTLQRRLRKTDVAGVIRDGVIGAFLPDTPVEGARKVAGDILELLDRPKDRVKYDVYVYPDPWWPEDSGHERSDKYTSGTTNGHSRWEQNGDRRAKTLHSSPPHVNGNGHKQVEDVAAQSTEMRGLFEIPTPLWKRTCDILGATTGMMLLSPVFLLAAMAVKTTSPGPIFFCQRRAGLGGRPFTIWKFRTMCDEAEKRKNDYRHLNEQDGAAFKIKDDPRVTRVGSFLRKTSIDELPQLWNVLRGDMSLVGPRPLPVDESNACEQWQRRRLDVTPGLTCTWQVFGRSQVTFEEWMRMDLRYADHRTWHGDARLLLQTIPAVLARRGAS